VKSWVTRDREKGSQGTEEQNQGTGTKKRGTAIHFSVKHPKDIQREGKANRRILKNLKKKKGGDKREGDNDL